MDEAKQSHAGRWLIMLVVALVVAVVWFFWWQNQEAKVRAKAPAQATATVQLVSPGASTQSVANFPVGKAISQEGTLEGPISGQCGNIKWHDLSPREVAHLRKLCPPTAATHQP
ncbi:hypothetical protein GL267_015020 [Acidithiobacillus ferrianus]|uniref:Uncharacterized protein n=2 Tax=Acidithiobacillus ferrianus TaxID=2678518 RepID=A0A845U983_9PROT|nr:hypothetical protein [Acidithiobacillus ferrianus]NDU42729.1 hypothetical protein [Acidithiobacillus ferrianus]